MKSAAQALVDKHSEHVVKFRDEVCAKANEIDEEEQYDWFALSYGFFLALGISQGDAEKLACIMRYDFRYFEKG